MNSYNLPFQITEKMTILIGEISEEIGRISVCYKKIVNPHLRKEKLNKNDTFFTKKFIKNSHFNNFRMLLKKK